MQRKKNIRNEKGSIAVIVTATLFSFYVILLGLYTRGSFVRRSQLMADIALKSHYEVEVVGLVEKAQNARFGWKLKETNYTNHIASITIMASDDTYNLNSDLFTKNVFNGNFKFGYLNPSDGLPVGNPDYPNSVYTDYIYAASSQYKCAGQNDSTEVVWLSYRADGTFVSSSTGKNYTRPSGAVYFRVMWPKTLTKQESDKILIHSSHAGDTETSTYEAPSNKIRILVNGIDVTASSNLTVYETVSEQKRREYKIEVRNVPTEGYMRVEIAPNTISRVVEGRTEYNGRNVYSTGIKITK